MNRKVLGRGLNALMGDEDISGKEVFLEIDLDLIKPNGKQPRTNFTEAKLEELAQSIRINGVVQPIIVRKKGANYEIVAGERRWRASQKAGLYKIPAIVREIKDEKLLELALIENIQRQELNAIEEAKAYRNLVETIGLTQEMIAERVGKNRTVITTFLRLLKLPDDIQNLVIEEKITAGHARAILMAENVDLQRELAQKIIALSLSVRETEKAAKKNQKNIPNSGTQIENRKVDPNVKAAETKMRRYLRTQIRVIPDGKGTGGKIEIEYYSETDLTRIYDLLMNVNS